MRGRMMMEVRTGFAMLAALMLVVPTTGEIASQEIVRIGANATCPAPGWALEEEVSFASDPELGLTGPAMAIYRRPQRGFAMFFGGRVHLFGSDGESEGSLGRPGEGPGEFGNVQINAPLSPETPPPPRPADVYEFGPREVGVLLMVPAEDPSEGMERQGDAWVPVRMDRIVAGRVEIIDPVEGCVRASLDIRGYPLRFLEDGAVAIYEEDDLTAEPGIRVLKIAAGG